MKTIVSQITSRSAFFKGQDTLTVGYPWLSFGAIIALESLVNKDLEVLEFGSGGSTLFWAKTCKSVKSFETNKEWYEMVKQKTKSFTNVDLNLANEAETLAYLAKENKTYDIILVDSYPKDIQRIKLAYAAVLKVKKGGWLILDNYLNFGMQNFKYPKSEIYTFDEFRYSGRGTRLCKIL